MKRFNARLVISVCSLALLTSAAAMNNKDVIKMQKAGLSEDTILAAMQKETPEYDTGTDALIELKGAGVSDRIIQKMITLKAGGGAAATEPAAPAASSASSTAFYGNFPSIAPPKIQPVVGKEYFTRFTFFEEKNEHVTTNYSRGSIVPINTPVRLISMAGSQLVLKRGDTGQDVKVKNEDKYTKKSIAEIASLMLAEEKTPLEKLPETVAAAVRSGEMRKGMTKELVLMTRGYPPAHETPSIDGDRWVYWSSRFVKLTILFADGRLAEGRGLY
jgi:hypothetical protein